MKKTALAIALAFAGAAYSAQAPASETQEAPEATDRAPATTTPEKATDPKPRSPAGDPLPHAAAAGDRPNPVARNPNPDPILRPRGESPDRTWTVISVGADGATLTVAHGDEPTTGEPAVAEKITIKVTAKARASVKAFKAGEKVQLLLDDKDEVTEAKPAPEERARPREQ